MKKSFLICLLALSLLLCGCADGAEQKQELASALEAAIEKSNSETRISGGYMLEITFDGGVTLYYALGNIAFDRENNTASADFTQTYLGKSVTAQNFYKNGKVVSVEKGESVTFDRAPEDIMGKFPYSKLLKSPESVTDIESKTSSVGKTITLTRGDTESICDSVIGSDLYTLVDVIKKPQTDKTQYSDTVCTYTVEDGRVVGCRYEFDVKLFDTPSYVPGYSIPESEYTLDIHVTAKVTYSDFGESVRVAEYSESEENS